MVERFVANSGISSPRTIRTRQKFYMEIDPRDFLQRCIYASGTWEPHVTKVIKERLKPGDTFVDIGANVGFFTLYTSHLVGPQGRIYAFEPNPEVFARLKRNVELNRLVNVWIYPVALSDHKGASALFLGPPDNSGAASLRRTASATAIQVPLDTFDDAFRDLGVARVAMIKIDVEGAEVLVLTRAVDTLRRDHPEILCEVSEWSLECMGSSSDELFQFLADLGYKWRRLSVIRTGKRVNGKTYHQFDANFFPG